jgi:UV DNA damage endonuclease
MSKYLGYCCINTELRNRKPARNSVYCGRSMTKKTFNLPEASRRALANVRDLLTILEWNVAHDIKCFRISSELFPRMTCAEFGYDFTDLPDHTAITLQLKRCGDYAIRHGLLLSFHPGPFTTLASPNPVAAQNGINEVEMHALYCNLIDPDNQLDIPINYHIGGMYKQDPAVVADRFAASFDTLSDRAQRATVLENDDKASCWSVQLLHKHIYSRLDIPITMDLHHSCFSRESDISLYDEFLLAQSTWNDRCMQVHYSQSPTADKLIPAHSYDYRDPMPSWVTGNVHVHLEAKGKELALLKYRRDFGSEV